MQLAFYCEGSRGQGRDFKKSEDDPTRCALERASRRQGDAGIRGKEAQQCSHLAVRLSQLGRFRKAAVWVPAPQTCCKWSGVWPGHGDAEMTPPCDSDMQLRATCQSGVPVQRHCGHPCESGQIAPAAGGGCTFWRENVLEEEPQLVAVSRL